MLTFVTTILKPRLGHYLLPSEIIWKNAYKVLNDYYEQKDRHLKVSFYIKLTLKFMINEMLPIKSSLSKCVNLPGVKYSSVFLMPVNNILIFIGKFLTLERE